MHTHSLSVLGKKYFCVENYIHYLGLENCKKEIGHLQSQNQSCGQKKKSKAIKA